MPTPADHLTAESSLLETMRAWSAAHPTATFAAIEVEAARAVAALRTELIRTALATRAVAPAPACPECGRAMVRNGTRTRTLITGQAEQVSITGPRYRCPACGAELFPPR